MRKLFAATLGMITACMPPTPRNAPMSWLPDGWREPTEAESDQEFRGEDSDRYLRAAEDFDGDGRRDQALLLIRKADRAMGLVVFLTRVGDSEAHQLYVFERPGLIEAMGVRVAQPGYYRILCDDDDRGPCGEDGKNPIALDLPAIDSFKDGSASSLFFWDRDARAFRQVWTSD